LHATNNTRWPGPVSRTQHRPTLPRAPHNFADSLNDEIRIIEYRVADPAFLASHPPVVDPVPVDPSAAERIRAGNNLFEATTRALAPVVRQAWTREARDGHTIVRHDPKAGQPFSLQID
jgi:hypothetical protein